MNEKLLILIVSLVCLVIGALVGYYAIPRQENYKDPYVPEFNNYTSSKPASVSGPESVTLTPTRKPTPPSSFQWPWSDPPKPQPPTTNYLKPPTNGPKPPRDHMEEKQRKCKNIYITCMGPKI
jgi:hypothetical protein